MGEEQAAQAAGRDLAGEISFIDMASDAIAQLSHSGFKLALVSADGGLGCFFTNAARYRRRIVGSGPRRIEKPGTEIRHRVLDHTGVEIIDRILAVAIAGLVTAAIESLR